MVHQSDLRVSFLFGSPPPFPPHAPFFFYCIGIVLGGEANIGKSQNSPILGRQYNTNTVLPSLGGATDATRWIYITGIKTVFVF